MKFILYFLVTALLVWLAAIYGGSLFGISLTGENTYITALIFSVILALVNTILGGILRLLTLPFNWITLGLVSFIITLIMIWVTDSMYESISIKNILGYIAIAIIPSIAATLTARK